MGNLRKLVLFLFGVYFLQTQAADKYTDENRPYEFGFKIDGEQHRHEKKDENGLIMGEFGFITADGVYHVTVYATDENGNFKILSMKNIRVKPYPTSPGAGVRKSKSSTVTAPQKDSVPESTSEEKIIKKQVASPAKSCSHCSLPTTTTTTISPVILKESVKYTNGPSTENYNDNQNNKNVVNQNPLQNVGDQQKHYNSKTHQFISQTVEVNYPQEEQNDKNTQNENLLLSQKIDYQDPNVETTKPQSYPQTNINDQRDLQPAVVANNNNNNNKITQNGNLLLSEKTDYQEPNIEPIKQQPFPQTNINDQSDLQPDVVAYNNNNNNKNTQNGNLLLSEKPDYQEPNIEPIKQQPYSQTNINNQSELQSDIVSNNPAQAINPDGAQYITPLNNPLSKNQHKSVPDVKQNNPSESSVEGENLQPNQEPISKNLQGPINEDYLPNQVFPQNNQTDDGVKNYKQNNLNSNNDLEGQSFLQQQNYEQGIHIKEPNQLTLSSPPTIINRQAILPYNEAEKSAPGSPKGERTPKSFGDFIHQSIGPDELASTGPNLYRPSIPNASDFSVKPVLLAAQIQKVDKNTNIHNKNPGESDGLPEGVTKDDINNLLYTFNYTVGFHGHHEKGYSNGAKQGYYYVTGRNGVRTRVDYVADEKGFRPKITQEILDIVSDEVPKPETEKDEKYGLKGYEFKWLYFPLDSKPI